MLSPYTGEGVSQSRRQSFTIHATKHYSGNTGVPQLANPILVSTSLAVPEISTTGNQDAKINPHTSVPARRSSSFVP